MENLLKNTINYFNISKEERKELLTLDFKERFAITNSIIKQVLNVAKYPIIQFSGGADSCLMAYLIHQIDKNVPCLFNDWGLFLPRQEEFCISFFKQYGIKYHIIRSGVNYREFLSKYGFPIFKGVKFISSSQYAKYHITTKCRNLKEICWKKYLQQYPLDYYFVGLVYDETPQRKSRFIQDGFVIKKSVGYMVKPIILWKKQEVLDYLNKHNIIYPKQYYQDTFEGTTFNYNHCDLGCFVCGIRFQEKGFGRIGRLARENIVLFNEIMDLGLREIFYKIIKDYPLKSYYLIDFLRLYDTKMDIDKFKNFNIF